MELARLKDAAWKKDDPVQKRLTWYGLRTGLAIADSKAKKVKRFTGLLDEKQITANGIAFGQEKVWPATDKGFMAWDRKLRYSSRFAVGGKLVQVPVTGLSLTKDGTLRVTVKEEGKKRRFDFDLKSETWREIPGQ